MPEVCDRSESSVRPSVQSLWIARDKTVEYLSLDILSHKHFCVFTIWTIDCLYVFQVQETAHLNREQNERRDEKTDHVCMYIIQLQLKMHAHTHVDMKTGNWRTCFIHINYSFHQNSFGCQKSHWGARLKYSCTYIKQSSVSTHVRTHVFSSFASLLQNRVLVNCLP